jgi:predicted membrane metal-binding protein
MTTNSSAATGTIHLMAISGLHIGMVAMLAAWAGGRIVHWRRAQSLGLTAMHGHVLAGLAAAAIYSVLAGLSVAVHAHVPVASLRRMIYAYPTFHRAIEDALRELADHQP